jgi:hypothetical protein
VLNVQPTEVKPRKCDLQNSTVFYWRWNTENIAVELKEYRTFSDFCWDLVTISYLLNLITLSLRYKRKVWLMLPWSYMHIKMLLIKSDFKCIKVGNLLVTHLKIMLLVRKNHYNFYPTFQKMLLIQFCNTTLRSLVLYLDI